MVDKSTNGMRLVAYDYGPRQSFQVRYRLARGDPTCSSRIRRHLLPPGRLRRVTASAPLPQLRISRTSGHRGLSGCGGADIAAAGGSVASAAFGVICQRARLSRPRPIMDKPDGLAFRVVPV
jgi:hypothetical protein